MRAGFCSLGRHGGGDAPGGDSPVRLESGDSIADFDLIGFSLGYEMAYTNVLNMLDLGWPSPAQRGADRAVSHRGGGGNLRL